MTRKYTRKKKIEPEVEQKIDPGPEIQTEKPVETDQIEDLSGLPNRDLYRINEVADYLRVSESTIRLWIQHGYFQIEKMRGTVWIPKESILRFRLKNRINP